MESGSDSKEIEESTHYHDLLMLLYNYAKTSDLIAYRTGDYASYIITNANNKLTYILPEDKSSLKNFWELQGYGYVHIQSVGHLSISCYNVYLTELGHDIMVEYNKFRQL